jgi:hypothetical protein
MQCSSFKGECSTVVLGELLGLEFNNNKPLIHCNVNGTKPFDPSNDKEALETLCKDHKITVSDDKGVFYGYSQENIKGESKKISRSSADSSIEAAIYALIALLQTNSGLMDDA